MDKILTSDISATNDAAATSDTASRAVVAVTPARPAAGIRQPAYHRPAVFLAHLIATKDRHPQTRERRRAEPSDASLAYRRTMAATARAQ